MIGFFPDPYPDELLYSVCARYAERVKYVNRQFIIEEMFGRRGLSAVVDFPLHIRSLLSVIASNKYTEEEIIDDNSLLPFYSPFVSTSRVGRIVSEMINDDPCNILTSLGIRGKQLVSPRYLRFCPNCVIADRERYAETYWHRLHQLSGVLVCPVHKCFLENSLLNWGRESSSAFQTAEEFIPLLTPRYVDSDSKEHNIILKIAKDAEWLLSQKKLCLETGELQKRYFNLLLKKGFAYYNGRVRHNRLVKACNEYFSPKLFEQIGRLSERDNWLTTLIESHKKEVVFHPIRHLLLMTFLGLTAEEFFTSFVEFKPFGDPPYPCLNITAEHYREMRIDKCEIYDNLSKDNRKKERPIAYFTCDCGFIYQRIGPDKSGVDKFSYDFVREYGHIWEEKLTELWSDLTLSGPEIGKRLGVSDLTVRRHAIRLNLPMNTEGARSLQGYDRHRSPKSNLSKRKQNYRNDWLEVIKNNPDLTRNELMNTEIFLYLWLRRNDEEWFEEHLPAVEKVSKRNIARLDWKKIDKDLSEEIETVCHEIYNLKRFPVRVSTTEIIRRIGYQKWINKRLDGLKSKFPITNEVLDKHLESFEDYMIRKLVWAKDKYIEEKAFQLCLS